MNIAHVTFVNSTQSSATTEQTWPHWPYSWGPTNGILPRSVTKSHLNSTINMHEGRDCQTSNRNYMPLMISIGMLTTFTTIHWGWMRCIALFCSGLSPWKAIFNIIYHSFQPQDKLPMFQHKVTNEVDDSQHTLTLSLDSRLKPGLFMGNAKV